MDREFRARMSVAPPVLPGDRTRSTSGPGIHPDPLRRTLCGTPRARAPGLAPRRAPSHGRSLSTRTREDRPVRSRAGGVQRRAACPSPFRGQSALARLLVAELQAPLDEVGHVLELVALLLDEMRRGHEVLRVGQDELKGEGTEVLPEASAQALGSVLVEIGQLHVSREPHVIATREPSDPYRDHLWWAHTGGGGWRPLIYAGFGICSSWRWGVGVPHGDRRRFDERTSRSRGWLGS